LASTSADTVAWESASLKAAGAFGPQAASNSAITIITITILNDCFLLCLVLIASSF
jgi:hypothetical protein